MKTLADQISLKRKLEEITLSEFRRQPGEVIAQVVLGKTFVITKTGKPVSVLSPLPGEQLSQTILGDGSSKYKLAS